MNAIESRVSAYFDGLQPDPAAERALMHLIDDLSSNTATRTTLGTRSHRLVAAACAAVATAAVVALLVVFTTRGGHTAAGGGPPAPSHQISTTPSSTVAPTPPVGTNRGFQKVYATNGRVGWAQRRWLNGMQMQPHSPAEALRWQKIEGKRFGWSIPVFAHDLHTVIGRFDAGGSATISCDQPVGLGLVLDPPSTTVGAATPIAAARTIQTRYGIANFGTRQSAWTEQEPRGSVTPVTANDITLNTKQLPNRTWVLTGGQNCSPPD